MATASSYNKLLPEAETEPNSHYQHQSSIICANVGILQSNSRDLALQVNNKGPKSKNSRKKGMLSLRNEVYRRKHGWRSLKVWSLSICTQMKRFLQIIDIQSFRKNLKGKKPCGLQIRGKWKQISNLVRTIKFVMFTSFYRNFIFYLLNTIWGNTDAIKLFINREKRCWLIKSIFNRFEISWDSSRWSWPLVCWQPGLCPFISHSSTPQLTQFSHWGLKQTVCRRVLKAECTKNARSNVCSE